MTNHVFDLVFHGDREQSDEVDEEDGPEDRDVEEAEERAQDGHQDRSGD